MSHARPPDGALALDATARSAQGVPRPAPPTWRAPIALGGLGTVGLLSALVGDGPWDALSWAALGMPVAVSAWYGLRRRPPD